MTTPPQPTSQQQQLETRQLVFASIFFGFSLGAVPLLIIHDYELKQKPDVGLQFSSTIPNTNREDVAGIARDYGLIPRAALVEACGRAVDIWLGGDKDWPVVAVPDDPRIRDTLARRPRSPLPSL